LSCDHNKGLLARERKPSVLLLSLHGVHPPNGRLKRLKRGVARRRRASLALCTQTGSDKDPPGGHGAPHRPARKGNRGNRATEQGEARTHMALARFALHITQGTLLCSALLSLRRSTLPLIDRGS
jgi:hypothetical protein